MSQRSCSTCGNFDPAGDDRRGVCRFGPPAVLLAGVQPPKFAGGAAQPIVVSAWPTVSAGEWCAMWAHRYPEPVDPLTAPNWRDREPGSDTFRAGPPTPRAPDYTSTHKPERSPGGNWFCARCEIAEAMFPTTQCLPPTGVLTATEE